MSDEHVIENYDPTVVEMDVHIEDDGDVILDSGGNEMLVLEEEREELSKLLSVETSVESGSENE